MNTSRQDSTSLTPLRSREEPDLAEFERFLRHVRGVEFAAPLSLRGWLELAEAWRITQALRDCGGNRSAAARALGIGRRTLYAKMDKLGITPSWGV
jgi:DNA-binding NtrC family response regulator